MQQITPIDTASDLETGPPRAASGHLDDALPLEDDPTGTRVDHLPPLLEFDFDDDEPVAERDPDVRSDDITLYT